MVNDYITIIIVILSFSYYNCYKNNSNSLNYCLTSSIINTNLDGIHSYPIDLFNLSDNYNINNNYIPLLYNCTSTEISHKYHKCLSNNNNCPIDKIDLFYAQKKMTWLNKHSLCNFKNTLHDYNSINTILILGGSVTSGLGSAYCCCDQTIDNNCYNMTELPNYELLCLKDAILCRWSNHFKRWIQSISFNKVNVLNVADGGVTSPYMAEILGNKLKDNDINQLTSNDIVFIDHSVNDGLSFHSRSKQEDLSKGLDTLIKRIYHYSKLGSWPSIILLEFWPYPSISIDINERPDKASNDLLLYDYSNVYVNFAKTYNITLWSYRDMIWSKHIESKFNKYSLDYLRFFNNMDFIQQHPPWFIHLYFSDMIAGLLYQQLQLCDYNTSNQLLSDDMNIDKLPKLYNTTTIQCSDFDSPLLDLSAKQLLHNHRNHKSVGSCESSSNISWLLYEDRKGKYGWIDEFNSVYNESLSSLYEGKYFNILTFFFDNTNNKLINSLNLIRIHYMRTYKNAGTVDVYLCNDYLTTLDSLWNDYDQYHISMTQLYSHLYDSNDTNSNWNDRVMYCKDKSNGTLEFKHKYSHRPYYDKNYELARQNEKFKLVAVKICPIL